MIFKIHSFRVEKELLKKIKIICAMKGITMTDFVMQALTTYLEKMMKQ